MTLKGGVFIRDVYIREFLYLIAPKLPVYFGILLRRIYERVFLYYHESIIRGVYIRRYILHGLSKTGSFYERRCLLLGRP